MQAATEFPYGLDPRAYGLNKWDYQSALREHRAAEHRDVMAEHRERDRVDAEMRARRRAEWIDPIKAFSMFAGFLFWCFVWFHVFFTVLPNIGRAIDRVDAQTCLADLAKCEAKAKGIKQ